MHRGSESASALRYLVPGPPGQGLSFGSAKADMVGSSALNARLSPPGTWDRDHGRRGLAAEPRSRAVRGRVPRQRNRRGGSAEPNGRRLEGSRRRDCRSSTQVIVGDRGALRVTGRAAPGREGGSADRADSDRCSRRTPAIDCNVRRPCRLDSAVGAARSRGYARGRRRLSSMLRRSHRQGWRLRRQIHGRRGARLLRLSAGART